MSWPNPLPERYTAELVFGPYDRLEDAQQAMLDDLFNREVSAA
jgi:hypothetical protein